MSQDRSQLLSDSKVQVRGHVTAIALPQRPCEGTDFSQSNLPNLRKSAKMFSQQIVIEKTARDLVFPCHARLRYAIRSPKSAALNWYAASQ